MKQLRLIIFLTLLLTTSFSQKRVSCNVETGIDLIEQQYVDAWKKIKKIEGFRIQIASFSGINSRSLIEQTAEQFRQQFSNVPFYITYFEPNFRLRTGNYRTKLEAYNALQKIMPLFPGAFLVKEQIDFKKQ